MTSTIISYHSENLFWPQCHKISGTLAAYDRTLTVASGTQTVDCSTLTVGGDTLTITGST
jgi:hypothetical protein